MALWDRIRVLAVLLASTMCSAYAGAIHTPSDLQVGDTYRLIFVTDSTTSSDDANIVDYNTFVTNEANAHPELSGLATTWTALISTDDVNVLTNTGLSGSDSTTRFYNTRGELIAIGVANSQTGLYSTYGSATHSAAIYNPSGDTPAQILAWTGTSFNGSTSFFAAGNPLVLAGNSSSTAGAWTASDALFQFDSNAGQPNLLGLYAVSSVLTVPTPEPSTFATGGLALLLAAVRLRWRN